ncbi:MAG: translation initiation factor IF-3 [Deltaproteobacteria bacterium CG_4_10_14_0_2_um_filter_43_8]|nr:MAG: translation initiation factor IF-3 [Deltaproteobacteria bacterium CG11_big_fil_rev_8_21_14_0_20_42_23]PJA22359.1 MAG: translation initiation factor IF-3 [Deltaproteobacteria bacterium CG_4_10_14_0_2_um_filter_43_8]PJC64679.1 MAG: translation initiation factor IF-3 [Deltaproteobacteria bacterium CG_4_9_14_0_2_um_filter_42_21]
MEQRRPKREGPRINRFIRIPQVRLVDENGEQFGIVDTREALQRAQDVGLDLVEVSPTARPPVCKIMDFGKYKYEMKKKMHEAKKHQIQVKLKEIKLRPTTDDHDFQTKLRHAKKFLEHGDKVKFSIRFRGREMAHQEIGMGRLKEVTDLLKEIAQIDLAPKLEGRQMAMVLSPLKKK